MQSKRLALLIGARPGQGFVRGDQAPAATHAGVNCTSAMPEASPTFGWYRPQRLLSQTQRAPG